ncbi:unnamed protein product [Bursaphelenchus okinawaensis]|uniref:Sphingomyelin phosphodiesterase n=1 Tax=Bursaphelenchus okinawaensis TaxID=465554 RepID=A0A811LHU8_9BILA|nr:unnamed protein product [Bursaphelenchus okinawaensis]CAG9125886.1 unnamed protein product [Bursaphelenchus okinawaensis]
MRWLLILFLFVVACHGKDLRTIEGDDFRTVNVEAHSNVNDGDIVTGDHGYINEDDLLCSSCKYFVHELEKMFDKDLMKECIVPLVSYLCETFKIQSHTVCKGIVSQFKDEFLYVVKQLTTKPAHLCGLLLPDCDKEDNPLYSNWTIPIPGGKPPKRREHPPENSNGPTLKVLHITDIHVDLDYAVGTESDCGEPQCCRWPKQRVDKIKKPAGYWGSVGNCDIPLWTVEDMLRSASTQHGPIDYIVVTGDLESHADWDYSKEEHLDTVKSLFSLFNKYFPYTPLYFALGNHEGYPVDNVAPHSAPEKFQMTWLYEAMLDQFGRWLSQAEKETFLYNACFSTLVAPNLRVISLNTILGDKMNFFLYLNQTDPDGAMSWFANELAKAEKNKEKVQVLAHLPSGSGETFEQWAINYYNLINRYEDTIVAQFVGHTHTNVLWMTFKDMESAQSRPTSVMYSGPSVTSYTDSYPAYRIYTVDGNRPNSTYKIIDYADYYLDLEEANEKYAYKDTAPWKPLYTSVKKEYNLNSLEPEDWKGLIDRLAEDKELMRKFEKNVYRRDNGPCEAECTRKRICQMVSGHHSPQLCQSVGKGFENRSFPPPAISGPALGKMIKQCPI